MPVVGSAAGGWVMFVPPPGAPVGDLEAVGIVAVHRRLEERTHPDPLEPLQRHLAELRREVDQVVLGDPLHLVGGRTGRERLRRRQLLAGNLGMGHGPLLDGPDGLTGLPVQRVKESLLGGLEDSGDRLPVDGDVQQDGCGGGVEVPDSGEPSGSATDALPF